MVLGLTDHPWGPLVPSIPQNHLFLRSCALSIPTLGEDKLQGLGRGGTQVSAFPRLETGPKITSKVTCKLVFLKGSGVVFLLT